MAKFISELLYMNGWYSNKQLLVTLNRCGETGALPLPIKSALELYPSQLLLCKQSPLSSNV